MYSALDIRELYFRTDAFRILLRRSETEMASGELDPNEVVSGVVEKALNSEPVRNPLGPVTQNIGLVLGRAKLNCKVI
jgi:hypothetical protein